MKHIFLAFGAAFILLTAFFQTVQADDKDIVGILFYADWCGSCKILEPKLEKAREDEALKNIEFITFDLTDSESIQNARHTAEKENIDPVLQTYGAATGFVVVYDRGNDTIIKTLSSASSSEDIAKAFSTAAKG